MTETTYCGHYLPDWLRLTGVERISYTLDGNIRGRSKGCSGHGHKKVLQFSKDMEFIAEYSSMIEAEKATGARYQHIGHCCKGKYKSAGGFIWKWK